MKSFPLIYFPKNMNTNHSGTGDVSAAAGDFFLFPKKPFNLTDHPPVCKYTGAVSIEFLNVLFHQSYLYLNETYLMLFYEET